MTKPSFTYGVKVLFVLGLAAIILNSICIIPVMGMDQEKSSSPDSGKDHITIKDPKNATIDNEDKNASYNKNYIIGPGVLNPDYYDLKLDNDLRNLVRRANANETVQVIVEFVDQPAAKISQEVQFAHEPKIEMIANRLKMIQNRTKVLLGTEKNFTKNISEVIRLESRLLLPNETEMINETNRLLNQELDEMRKEVYNRSAKQADSVQAPVIERMESNGSYIKYSYKVYNSIAADVPVSYLSELSQEPSVARIYKDQMENVSLSISVPAIYGQTWWTAGYVGTNFEAAVIDTGIDSTHPALPNVVAAGVFHQSGRTSSLYNDNPSSTDDLHGHGTHCAGIIASRDSTYRGVAYGADLINAKAGWKGTDGKGHLEDSDIMAAADWALLQGADVLSCSFGGEIGANGETAMCHYFDQVVTNQFVTVVAAAANSGPNSQTVASPGSAYNVITVGNINDQRTETRTDDDIWSTSSRGPTGDGRRKPDISAPGTSIMSCNNNWEALLQDRFVPMTGTSMATPHVAGSILLLDCYDGYHFLSAQKKALLLNTAEDKGDVNTYGYGYINLAHVIYHKDDVHSGGPIIFSDNGSVMATEHPHFFKGYATDGDTATLVWHKIVGSSLDDLDLYMFDESNNNMIDNSISSINNVERVKASAEYPSVVLKVNYFTGNSHFALATEEGFTEVQPPIISTDLSVPFYSGLPNPGRVNSGSTFTVAATVRNDGDLNAFAVQVNLVLPSGFELVSGSNPQFIGKIDAKSSAAATWTVRAPTLSGPWNTAGQLINKYQFTANTFSSAYYETFSASDSKWLVVSVPNAWIQLDSYNYPGRYIRHKSYLGEVDPINTLDTQDFTFRLVPGLADSNFVSFESVNFPGYYLRHSNYRLTLQKGTSDQLFKNDATFKILPGLAYPDGYGFVSFESYNFPGYYIRHSGFHLYLGTGTSDLFKNDATFWAKDCWASLRSYNFPAHYMRHRSYLGELTTVSSSTDKSDASFRIVPGLADSTGVSFESLNFPDYYLKHTNFRLILQKATSDQLFKSDATFWPRRGLQDSSAMSFESYNFPGFYIRHSNFHLYVQRWDTDLFKRDATFWLNNGLSAPIF